LKNIRLDADFRLSSFENIRLESGLVRRLRIIASQLSKRTDCSKLDQKARGNRKMGDNKQENSVDDQGTTEDEGRALLKSLRDAGFQGSDEKLATALGRPLEEVQGWMGGGDSVDDDVVMKARGIAKERGVEID
jgi:hypothetical protein